MPSNRAMATDPVLFEAWFEKMKKIYDEHNFYEKPCHIFMSYCLMYIASQSTAEQFKWKSCYDCDQWFCGDCAANIVLNSQAETDEFCCSECL